MKYKMLLFLLLIIGSCSDNNTTDENQEKNEQTVAEFNGSINAPFGSLPYRVYYPEGVSTDTYPIILSRGGNGRGDDRGKLLAYATNLVNNGYLVVQIDHRNAGIKFENIAKLRGEEVQFLSEQIANGQLDYGGFSGSVIGTKQGFIGHSAGCMEGLLAAGVNTTHGNYYSPAIKAVYGMSAPGFSPDMWGISQSPNGFSEIQETALLLISGEQEKDSNGPGTISQEDWRLQGFDEMNKNGLRIQVLVQGDHTSHEEIGGLNNDVKLYHEENSLALFETYLKGNSRTSEIGNLAQPPDNELSIQKKGQ